jgi:hypothetical protein
MVEDFARFLVAEPEPGIRPTQWEHQGIDVLREERIDWSVEGRDLRRRDLAVARAGSWEVTFVLW